MKRLIFTLLVSVSLTACESMSDMSMPSWSSLNPFSSKQTEETASPVPQTATSHAAPALAASSAISTEMAEMEFLTGTAPRFDNAPAPVEPTPEVAVEKVAADTLPAQEYHKTTKVEAGEAVVIADKDLPISEARVAEVNAAIESELAPKPIPATKPAQATAVSAPVTETVATEPVVEPQPVAVTDIGDTPPEMQGTETQQPAVVAVAEPIAEIQNVEQQAVEQPAPQTQEQPDVAAVAPVIAAAPIVTETAPQAVYDEAEPILDRAEGCPIVEIMPSARSITYFENEMSGRMVARASISEIRGGCEYKNGGMEIDLDILMKGKITSLGRFEGNQDMEAFMTFPYFVAVSTPQGLPVDKQILATAMQFKPMVDDLDHAEKITQFIPLANAREGANYKILVGFQLNRKQMEYNRAVNINRLDNDIQSSDVIPRSRVSTNPLTD